MEYGARLPISKVVYMHSESLETVKAFIAEYSSASPLELVHRVIAQNVISHWITL